MDENKAALLRMIDRLLRGEWTVPEFRERYYDFYLEVPSSAFDDEQDCDFFSLVHERLDWADADPDKESRRYGWVTYDEYVDWLRVECRKYAQ